MSELLVGKVSDFAERDRKVIVGQGREIGVFRLGEEFFAWENQCPHMGGPVCQGKILNRVEERIGDDKRSLGFQFSRTQVNIVCPWHGYEYDIRTGLHQGNADVRLTPVAVIVRQGEVYVIL
jgi:nitrite reductase (NADH) small subunit